MVRLAHQQGEVGSQKIVVFEEPEKRQIRRKAGNQHRLLPPGRLRSFQPDSRREIDGRQSQQQWNEVVIPGPVEVITGNQQNISANRPRAHIEQHQHNSQKKEEVDGVKKHGLFHRRHAIRRTKQPDDFLLQQHRKPIDALAIQMHAVPVEFRVLQRVESVFAGQHNVRPLGERACGAFRFTDNLSGRGMGPRGKRSRMILVGEPR